MRITRTRARLHPDLHNHASVPLLSPVSARGGKVVPESYFGNACSLNTAKLPNSAFEKPLGDLPALCCVASAIRRAILDVDDERVCLAIAVVNQVERRQDDESD
jgi:hypothetical protein